MSASAPTAIGVIAHYNLLERLEPSGPGELYRARDTRHGRTVFVRLLPRDFEGRNGSVASTAQSLVRMSHPNVVTLFDAGEHEGRVYLAFEFLKGRSLRAEMAGRPMPVRRAVEIAIQIADAVADAHTAGFLHGGLSPDSIAVTEKGHAKIPAFELAAREGFETLEDGRIRLRDYGSPEEARGEPPDDRSDVYSIGAMLYEMVACRVPSHRGAAAPSGANPAVPPELDRLALKAVAPNPASRQASAAILAADLRALLPVLDARGLADDPELTAVRSGGPTISTIVATALAVLVALLAWYFWRQ